MEDRLFWLIDKILTYFALPFIIFLFFYSVAMFFVTLSQETFSLIKDEWKCTDYKTMTTLVLVGKVMVPQVHSQCIRYERIR